MERLLIADSMKTVLINATNPTDYEINLALSSTYQDSTVLLEPNNEVVSCELSRVELVEGKPAVSIWQVTVHQDKAVRFFNE